MRECRTQEQIVGSRIGINLLPNLCNQGIKERRIEGECPTMAKGQ